MRAVSAENGIAKGPQIKQRSQLQHGIAAGANGGAMELGLAN